MSATSLITLRLPASLVERADALLDQLHESEESVLLGRSSRSTVLRLALLRGIEQLEAQVAASDKPAGAVKHSTSASKKKRNART